MESDICRIIILEDEEDHSVLLKRVLGDLADHIDVAKDSTAFFQLLELSPAPRLLIIDNNINGDPNFKNSETGYKVVEALRNSNNHTPIILTSMEQVDEVWLDGMHNPEASLEFLNKPFDLESVYQLAREFIDFEPKVVDISEDIPYFIQFSQPHGHGIWSSEDSDAALQINFSKSRLEDLLKSRQVRVRFPDSARKLKIEIGGVGVDVLSQEPHVLDLKNLGETGRVLNCHFSIRQSDFFPRVRPIYVNFYIDGVLHSTVRIVSELFRVGTRDQLRLLTKQLIVDSKLSGEPRMRITIHNSRSEPNITVTINQARTLDELRRDDYDALAEAFHAALHKLEKSSHRDRPLSVGEALENARPLFEIGIMAFKRIFNDPKLRKEIREFFARADARDSKPIIEIVTDEDYLIPWELLYLPFDEGNGQFDIRRFWGMGAYVYSLLTGQSISPFSNTRINANPLPKVAFVRHLDTDIILQYEVKLFRELNGVQQRDGLGSENEFKHFMEERWDIVQITGHGYRNPFLKISLGDGDIHSHDVMNFTMPDGPLVVVNACAGLASEDGHYFDLLKAFMRAGARGVLGSSIRIQEGFASKFVTKFYTQILKGKRVGNALHYVRWSCWDNTYALSGLFYQYYGELNLAMDHYVEHDRTDPCSVCVNKSCIASNVQL